ncbi:hypothetical protein [Arcobacter lacus]|uniref:hypothetical protein n=1 Tax=Arcobacter lacus TaxID=1912876 RepID=UPI001AE99D74|nr:hypothetical protein [Arcobacter lacus]
MAKILDIAKFANDAYEIETKLGTNTDFTRIYSENNVSNGFQASAYFNSKINELVVA